MTGHPADRAYMAIDGGGSQTRCLLVDSYGQVLAQAKGGPANINQVTYGAFLECLETLIQQALAQTRRRVVLQAACIGLAGAGSEKARERIHSVLDRLTVQPTFGYLLKTDAEIALSGAYVDQPGNILIAGTGSICLGRDTQGQLHRTGGHGPELDDLGSGSWISREAIRRATQHRDQPVSSESLIRIVKEHFKIADLDILIARLQTKELSNQKIAQLCPEVFNLAITNDPAAKAILRSASSHLCSLILTTCLKTQMDTVALFGGLLKKGSLLRHFLIEQLDSSEKPPRIIKPPFNAMGGALIDALQMSPHPASDRFLDTLSKQTEVTSIM